MWWVPRGEWIREVFPSDAAYNWFQLGYILVGAARFLHRLRRVRDSARCARHGNVRRLPRADAAVQCQEFLGNLFAMGTPWLIFLAGLEFFAARAATWSTACATSRCSSRRCLIPMSYWWFLSLEEPGFAVAASRRSPNFWHDMRTTISNKTFLSLTAIIFTLAMGFNFVGIFANYITIFYLYGGDVDGRQPAAGNHRNGLGRDRARRRVPAQLARQAAGQEQHAADRDPADVRRSCEDLCYNRIVWLRLPGCHRPSSVRGPTDLIPTMLLSAGMLMFFTLGSSMVGDVCDEDELNTGTRSEGSYYSVFWWFIKMGTAFASFVMGALLVFTHFDETQNVTVDALQANVASHASRGRSLGDAANAAD